MSRGVRWVFGGSVILVALAGCGRSFLSYEVRAPWRKDAEVACLNSGTVKEGAGVVRISPIDGPGMCGADFPLKVAALGESAAMGYGEELRPPGSIPGASRSAAEPRWPIQQQPYNAPVAQPRWPIQQQPYNAPVAQPRYAPQQPGGPMSIEAPGVQQGHVQQGYQQLGAPPSNLRAPAEWQRAQPQPSYQVQPNYQPQPNYQQQPAHNLPQANYPPPQQTYQRSQTRRGPAHSQVDDELPQYARPDAAPSSIPAQRSRPLPVLGPQRQQVMASMPVEVKPNATLACPIVSALDRWIVGAVQPAALKWFRQPVAEIKQISAYSCRGMNGQAGAPISEHAFGNALDIAAFVLADGKRVTVKGGWRGSPEEQGFLRDIQGAACDQFTTVLAPGSNQFHYDHIHVDLMRRPSGRRICNPGAVDGDLVAAQARRNPAYASRRIEPEPMRRYDPMLQPGDDPFGWRGDRRDPATTGSVVAQRPGIKNPAADDNDWVEDPGPRPAIDWTTNRHNVH
jgi:hypothetical protein